MVGMVEAATAVVLAAVEVTAVVMDRPLEMVEAVMVPVMVVTKAADL